jgi:hypothetical protein
MSGPHAAAAREDLTRPGEILASAPVRSMIDFSQPVAILLVAILHFILDDADPAGCVAELMDAAAPGSYLIISHTEISQAHAVGTDYQSESASELRDIWKKMPQGAARGRSEIEGFFRGLTLVEPGLVDIWAWRPDSVTAVPATDVMRVLGGVARKGEPGRRDAQTLQTSSIADAENGGGTVTDAAMPGTISHARPRPGTRNSRQTARRRPLLVDVARWMHYACTTPAERELGRLLGQLSPDPIGRRCHAYPRDSEVLHVTRHAVKALVTEVLQDPSTYDKADCQVSAPRRGDYRG